MRSLEPVWSGCQCVLNSTPTFEVPVAFATSFSSALERSAEPPSTIRAPVSFEPSVTTLPPAPLMSVRLPPSEVGLDGLGGILGGRDARAPGLEPTDAMAALCRARWMNRRRIRSFIAEILLLDRQPAQSGTCAVIVGVGTEGHGGRFGFSTLAPSSLSSLARSLRTGGFCCRKPMRARARE